MSRSSSSSSSSSAEVAAAERALLLGAADPLLPGCLLAGRFPASAYATAGGEPTTHTPASYGVTMSEFVVTRN